MKLLRLVEPAMRQVSSCLAATVFTVSVLVAAPQMAFAAGGGAELEHFTPERSDRSLQRGARVFVCLLYTSPSPRDRQKSRMPSFA